jgi:hypothetical protein
MSNPRPPWRAMFVVAIVSPLALAAACGPPDASGTRGSSGTGGGLGSSADGAPLADGALFGDGAALADAVAPFDGGACVDNVGLEPHAVSASGSFAGPGVDGLVCTRGALAYVESTPAADGGAPQVALYIDNEVTGSPADRIRFVTPADALAGEVHVDIGIAAATPGTYDATESCGSAVLGAILPVPSSLDCDADGAAESGDCPPGCELSGPLSALTCTAIEPEITYAALASSDCVGDSTTPEGSWTLTLTSVVPYAQDAGVSDSVYYEAHGTLTATLAGQAADAGASSVSLTLSF